MTPSTLFVALLFLALGHPAASGQSTGAHALDPFAQATHGHLPCATPARPVLSAQNIQEQEHVRTQHGYSCYASGRCRLPNSHLYDAELLPRLVQYLGQDQRFADSVVWVGVQRRLVTLAGCVTSPEQAVKLEQAALLVDDVMGVINVLQVVPTPPRVLK